MAERSRLRANYQGAVQGVGFRPFVYRLCTELALDGWVINDNQGLTVEAEGEGQLLEQLLRRIVDQKPVASVIESTVTDWLDPVGYDGFEIRASDEGGERTVQILPEIATCDACLMEVFDGLDRRHRYPFTNCTLCGPRFSIVRSLPYDRPRTTMNRFVMCEACQKEYETPADRRFHAQPNACPECGPRLALWDEDGVEQSVGDDALRGVVEALGSGQVLAVKGLGGFHLMVDARNGEAIARLRKRKHRHGKPLALMVRDLEQARALCRIDEHEAEALVSPQAPIVLLRRDDHSAIDEQVSPGNPYLGLMLPYSPLHHLILREAGFPVVATSGNISEEPICTDENEVLLRLGGIADLYLIHDRPIARHVDDSVAWVVGGETRLLRRARGYAPRPVLVAREIPTILAVGGHLKNSVALARGRQVFLSQHIGDMETPESLAAFEAVIHDFLELYDARPVAIAHDQHPDYVSTRWARNAVEQGSSLERLRGLRLLPVQHHHAHLASCLAENHHEGPALGVTWDGTGYGPDGTIWGGEFLLGTAGEYRRVATLRAFRLPGGDRAVREPRRSALGLLYEMLGEEALGREELAPVGSFSVAERRVLDGMLRGGVRSPKTSSAGRLFDGVAALIGLSQRIDHEGQAAMELEFIADPSVKDAYPIELTAATRDDAPARLDWQPLVEAVLEDLGQGVGAAVIAARFHNGLVDGIALVARATGQSVVALTGGCFQNRLLTERTVDRLAREDCDLLLHRGVPPNDGGISLGQVAVAAAQLAGD